MRLYLNFMEYIDSKKYPCQYLYHESIYVKYESQTWV